MVRVLVTRPQPAADRTAAKLRALGHEPLLLPLAAAKHEPSLALAALTQRPGGLVLTSAQAAGALASLGDALAPYLDIPLFAVGSATADAAKALGFRDIVTGPGTGKGLANMVLETTTAPLLYLAGTPRSPSFEQVMSEAGVRLSVCECYSMVDIDYSDAALDTVFERNGSEAILLFSLESARRLFDLSVVRNQPGYFAKSRFLCMSAAIAEAVPEGFGAAVLHAARPDEASLLALL